VDRAGARHRGRAGVCLGGQQPADILAIALHLAQLQHQPLPANEAAAAVPMITQSDNDARELGAASQYYGPMPPPTTVNRAGGER
jgi:hypothetical protein